MRHSLVALLLVTLLCCGTAIGHAGHQEEKEWRCEHVDDEKAVSMNSQVGVRSNAEMRRSGRASSPFRLRIIYDDSIESRPAAERDLIKNTYVEPAREFWTNALRVKYPLTGKIRKTRSCATRSWSTLNKEGKAQTYCIGQCAAITTCSGFVFPEKYLARCMSCTSENLDTCTASGNEGEGIDDADLVIFVMSANVSSCPAAAAYASTCERESSYFRSMIAVINICPPQINGGYDAYAMRGLLKHEIMHTLGMASSAYAYFVDADGNRLAETNATTGLPLIDPVTRLPQWSDKIVVTRELPWETPAGVYMVNRTMMIAPLVQQAVREHFNCPDLEGAELENQGGGGTQWSHLEKRIFAAENIGGVRTESQNVSRISLAIMESSGWYVANWSAAEIYYWGQNLGCDFVRKSCYAYIRDMRAANRDPAPFCDVLSRPANQAWWLTTCDATRNYPTECTLRYQNAPLPAEYQYFNSMVVNGNPSEDPRRYGGSIEFTDFCPYLRQQILPSPLVRQNRYRRCKDPSLNIPVEVDPYLEKYGGNSICVRQSSPFIQYPENGKPSAGNRTSTWGSGCYEVSCGVNVTIKVLDKELTCRRELESISFDISPRSGVRTVGELVCPLCEHACPNKLCPMQSYKVSVLDTLDRSKSNTDPIYQYPQEPVVISNNDEGLVIGLGVATGVMSVTTAVFAFLYFSTKKVVASQVAPNKA